MVLDMIRLYALKYRMQHASKQWLGAFCACGGVSVLVENMDNALEIYPLTDVNANALYQLMLCMRVVVESEGLAMVLETRGAIDVFAMCFHVDHKLLALEVLNMLCVVCFKGGSTAVWEVEFGIQHLAKAHRQKPFEIFKNAIGNPSVDYSVKVAIISFINNLFLGNEKIGTRIKHRFLLETIGFLDLCTSVNEQMKESNSKLLLQQSSHTHGNNGSSGLAELVRKSVSRAVQQSTNEVRMKLQHQHLLDRQERDQRRDGVDENEVKYYKGDDCLRTASVATVHEFPPPRQRQQPHAMDASISSVRGLKMLVRDDVTYSRNHRQLLLNDDNSSTSSSTGSCRSTGDHSDGDERYSHRPLPRQRKQHSGVPQRRRQEQEQEQAQPMRQRPPVPELRISPHRAHRISVNGLTSSFCESSDEEFTLGLDTSDSQ
jgi:hypothetical protein